MLKRIVIISFLIVCAVNVQAFTFEPITQDYGPSGKDANHIFRVANPGNEKIAIKISIRSRHLEPDGTEIQGDPSDLFLIYPRQMILNPGDSRSVRVKWTGEPEPTVELPFRIIAEQVPVSFAEIQQRQGGQLTLTYRYEGSIYIVPPGVKSDLSIKDIKKETVTETISETISETIIEMEDEEEVETQVDRIVKTEIDTEFLVLEIENSGGRHTILRKIEIKLKRDENDSNPIILTDNQLQGVAGQNILADSTRIFRVPVPAGIWEGPVYGSIKQESAY